MNTTEFLRTIQPSGPWALGAIHPDDGHKAWLTTRDLTAAQAFITEQAALGRNLYYQPDYAHPNLGRLRASKITMVAANAIHVDIDPPITVTTPEELAAWQAQMKQRVLTLNPSVSVFSGSGFQLLWLLDQPRPLGLVGDGTFHSLPTLVEEIESRNRGVAQSFGAEGDDIATGVQTLLRLPGTLNYPNSAKRAKGRTEPVLAEVIAIDVSKRYTLDQFPQAAPKPAKVRSTTEPSIYGPASSSLLTAAREALERHGPAIVGQHGDEHTLRVGMILLFDYALTMEEAWPLALEWNARNPGRQWSEDRLRVKLDNGRTYASGIYGEQRALFENAESFEWIEWLDAVQTIGESLALFNPAVAWDVEFKRALIEVKQLVDIKVTNVPSPIFTPCSEFLTKEYPGVVWLVRDLVKSLGTLIIGGEPKTSKSWMMLEIARAICTGTKAFGWFDTGPARRGAYFSAEDLGGDVQCHLNALIEGAKDQMPVEEQLVLCRRNLHIEPRGRFLDLLKDEDLALIIASCRRFGQLAFVFIEPLRDIHSGEENSSDGMAPAMKRLRLIGEILQATPGTAHHNKKNSEGRGGEKMRGSSALHGSVDSGIYLSNLAGDGTTEFTNTVESEIKGARSAGTFKLTLTLEDDMLGRAVSAKWAKNSAAEDTGDDKVNMYAVLRAVFELQTRDKPTTNETIRAQAKVGMRTLPYIRELARKRGYLVATHYGWNLTPEGRQYVMQHAERAVMIDASPVSITDVVPGIDGNKRT
jgi:hypothetical protein